MPNTVIKVENLSKQYRLGQVGTGTISHDLNRWWHRIRGKEDPYLKIGEANLRERKGDSQYVWALRDINFKVDQGQVLGIIGKNGAGKSTLLKLLSKVTGPTTGTIKAKGRVASLLEVGTGFHPELTGRENIYLNGTILGMTKAEVKKKLDEIVAFAGVERYLDTPVKRYSSGMKVRLGFAVAAHLEPEILIVDEVLAVGDAEFQKKAVGKMQQVSSQEGRTVLFVSHNLNSVHNLCPTSLLLGNGQIIKEGPSLEVIEYYLNNGKNDFLSEARLSEGDSYELKIEKICIADQNGNPFRGKIETLDPISIQMDLWAEKNVSNIHLTFFLKNAKGDVVFFSDRRDYHLDFLSLEKGKYSLEIKLPNPLLIPNKYYLSVGIEDKRDKQSFRKHTDIISFEIVDIRSTRTKARTGYLFLPLEYTIQKKKS